MTLQKPIRPSVFEVTDGDLAGDSFAIFRSDLRGVIRGMDEAFRRICGYDSAELLGTSEKALRHADMPEAVSVALSKMLQEGKPATAFFKNATKSGDAYWLLSVIVPVTEGITTISFRPSGPVFDQVRALYEDLKLAEKGVATGELGDLFAARLTAAGIPDPFSLMTQAISQLLLRRDGTRRPAGHLANDARIDELQANLTALQDRQSALMVEFDALQSIPTNMRIIASRLEPSGGPISAISDNYKFASTEISLRLETLVAGHTNTCRSMGLIATEALFLSLMVRLLGQLAEASQEDLSRHTKAELAAEITALAPCKKTYLASANSLLLRAEQIAAELGISAGEIRRMMLGLETIRVMGRVESGRLGPVGAGLAATIDQLETRHSVIAEHLQGLTDLAFALRTGFAAFRRTLV